MLLHLSVRSRALVAVPILATASIGLVAGAAGSAQAATRPAACGNYVVASVPLTNQNTNVTLPYSDGYVQLWYNSCTDYNFTHVVSELSGTEFISTELSRSDGNSTFAQYPPAYTDCTTSCSAPFAGPTSTSVYSPGLYSPVDADSAFGYVVADNVVYEGETAYY